MRRASSGQALAVVVVLITVMAILVPALVYSVQREATWSVKQSRGVTARELAESGLEKGFWALSISSQAWDSVQEGSSMAGFAFDVTYADIPGGTYAVWIGS